MDTFEQALLNFCQELGHEEDPDYQQEDALEFDGRISLSSKGFHCAPQMYDYRGNPSGFAEGRFVTSLTQVLHVSDGPEILNPFNALELHVHANINTGEEWEYAGQFPS